MKYRINERVRLAPLEARCQLGGAVIVQGSYPCYPTPSNVPRVGLFMGLRAALVALIL